VTNDPHRRSARRPAAFFVQGFIGFGASLVLAPLLLFVLDLHTAVVASALVQVPIGMWLTWNARTASPWPACCSQPEWRWRCDEAGGSA
jgi:hypothetical protein